jgi:hypothetical protein
MQAVTGFLEPVRNAGQDLPEKWILDNRDDYTDDIGVAQAQGCARASGS